MLIPEAKISAVLRQSIKALNTFCKERSRHIINHNEIFPIMAKRLMIVNIKDSMIFSVVEGMNAGSVLAL